MRASFHKGNLCEREVSNLSSYELIWRLIVLLLLSNDNQEDSQKTQD